MLLIRRFQFVCGNLPIPKHRNLLIPCHVAEDCPIARQFSDKDDHKSTKTKPKILHKSNKPQLNYQELNPSHQHQLQSHMKSQQKKLGEKNSNINDKYKFKTSINSNVAKTDQSSLKKQSKTVTLSNAATTSRNKSKILLDEPSSTEGESETEFELVKLKVPDWNSIKLVEINKKFYKPNETTSNRSKQEISNFREKNKISIENGTIKPIFGFDELNLNDKLLRELRVQNFENCTPIQSYGIPQALSGENMAMVAANGFGKLTANILSAAIHVSNQVRRKATDGPIAIILASTDEMVDEIRQIAQQICHPFHISCKHLQSQDVKMKNCDLLVSTPDALYDCLDEDDQTLHRCSFLSFFEVDRLIDLGFEDEIEEILKQIRPDCQKLFWSSTWNAEIRNFAIDSLDDFTRIALGSSNISITHNPNVKQVVKVCEESKKYMELQEFLKSIGNDERTIIFTETKEKAKKVSLRLQKKGFATAFLPNSRSEASKKIFDEFQTVGNIKFLFVTDVVARNLKFIGIKNVINYDFPQLMIDYVDRINRIGHLNDITCTAFSIFTEENGLMADEIIDELQKSNQTIDPALFILKAANIDSDDELSFAIPNGNSFKRFTIEKPCKK